MPPKIEPILRTPDRGSAEFSGIGVRGNRVADLKLILKFKIEGEAEWRVRGADRIAVESGRLTLLEHRSRALETIPLCRVQGLSIHSIPAGDKRP